MPLNGKNINTTPYITLFEQICTDVMFSIEFYPMSCMIEFLIFTHSFVPQFQMRDSNITTTYLLLLLFVSAGYHIQFYAPFCVMVVVLLPLKHPLRLVLSVVIATSTEVDSRTLFLFVTHIYIILKLETNTQL